MSLASVNDMKALGACDLEHIFYRPDGGAREGKIVSHAVHIPAPAAEISLHINDDNGGVLRTKIAIIWPRIWISFYVTFHLTLQLVVPSAPGAPIRVRLLEQVITMTSSVSTYGDAFQR